MTKFKFLNKMGYIYCITNLINEKKYVGHIQLQKDSKSIVRKKKDVKEDLFMIL
ncbi:hypothetical protein [Catenibacterium sp.]|uniref:hypothetical protein n=1 Tax=Catenibacterium sp. TaxID=2049022 RepID=UPI002E7A9576|nr:hypothetical protein [Catenibacterium sp.]